MFIRSVSSQGLALLSFGLVAAITAGGCAVSTDGGAESESIASAQQADQTSVAAPPLAHLDPMCAPADSGIVARNPGAPYHEAGTCASGDGISFDDAVAACGANVRYFGYSCNDFPAAAPYQPNDERGWSAYYGCCAPTCSDGIQNGGEAGVDCGGPCGVPCQTCSDGIQNGGEIGVDCGSACGVACYTRLGLIGGTTGGTGTLICPANQGLTSLGTVTASWYEVGSVSPSCGTMTKNGGAMDIGAGAALGSFGSNQTGGQWGSGQVTCPANTVATGVLVRHDFVYVYGFQLRCSALDASGNATGALQTSGFVGQGGLGTQTVADCAAGDVLVGLDMWDTLYGFYGVRPVCATALGL